MTCMYKSVGIMAIQTVFFGGCFSQQIYTLPPPADPWVEAMQTTAPHNVESDTMHLSDEYRAVDVHLSFVNSSSPSFCQSTTNQERLVSTYIINQLR
jgi:hypothetical protein